MYNMIPEQRLEYRLHNKDIGVLDWNTYLDDKLLENFSINIDWSPDKNGELVFELSSQLWTFDVIDSWYIEDKAVHIQYLLSKKECFTSTDIDVTKVILFI